MKSSLHELAIFGGSPAFEEPLHVGRPNIGSKEQFLQKMGEILDRRWLTNDGPVVREFEAQIAARAGVKHCLAMCNATVALEIATRATGMRDEVIVPSFTFAASAMALAWQGIRPIFCDIDRFSHNADPARVEAAITPRTKGIVAVHLWGRPCDIAALTEIAQRHQLPLVFDAAQAFGSTYRGEPIGRFGAAEVFSFHATKFINAFEGGAVVTNDDQLAEKIRLMRNFGFAGYDHVVHLGTNGKMSEASAAMGLNSLAHYDQFVFANRRNHALYEQVLGSLPGVKFHAYDSHEQSNYQYVILEVDPALAGLSRDELVKVLWGERVLARRYFYPGCHRMEPFLKVDGAARQPLPVTELVCERILALPTGTTISTEQIDKIAAIIRLALAHAGDVKRQLVKVS